MNAEPLTPDQIKIIKNHMPTIEKTAETFIKCLDIEVEPTELEDKLKYLIALIDTMETGMEEVKTILEGQL